MLKGQVAKRLSYLFDGNDKNPANLKIPSIYETNVENTYKNSEIPEKSMEDIRNIMKFNSFGNIIDGTRSTALFPLVSFINHSSKEKNVYLTVYENLDKNYNFGIIRANKNIKKGD